MRVQIADNTAFQSFDGRYSVFAEASQRLFELNPSALRVFSAMDEPIAVAELRETLGREMIGGCAALDRLLVEWSSCGLIELLPETPGNEPLEFVGASLESPAGPARLLCLGDHRDWFAPYDHLAREDEDEAVLKASGQILDDLGLVRIEGGASRIVPLKLLSTSFRFHLVESLLARNRSVALHCAVLVRDGSATVLMGPPGTGKSTMALFAARVGFAVGGDDIAFLDTQTQGIAPLALPLTLKSGSRKIASAAGFAIDSSQVVPRNDGVDVLYLPLPNAPSAGPLPVRAIVRLDRYGDEPPALRPWSPTECLEHLCSEALSRSGKASVETFRAMLGIVEQAETLTLSYGEAEQAASLLERHVSR